MKIGRYSFCYLPIFIYKVINIAMANNTYQNVALLGINWNEILNALPQSERGAYKLANIASPERQKFGTNSFRPLDVFNAPGTVSPMTGQPWTLTSFLVFQDQANSNFYKFTITNGAYVITEVSPTTEYAFNEIFFLDTLNTNYYTLSFSNGGPVATYIPDLTIFSSLTTVHNDMPFSDSTNGLFYELSIANGNIEITEINEGL
jgi:hypothetical protein